MLSCLVLGTSWAQMARREPSTMPRLPSEMKFQSEPTNVPPPLMSSGGDFSNDDMTSELRDPRNFGPPPTLDEIKKRRTELERERASATSPGLGPKASRLAQWLPDQDTPRQKAQDQLKKVKDEMNLMFGHGSSYAEQITRLGDVAIQAEVVPHMSAAKELSYMDGKGNTDEFFDVDFNHPIDSTAIQKGVAALKQTRQEHRQWEEEDAEKRGTTAGANNDASAQNPMQGLVPNLRSMATAAAVGTSSTHAFAPRNIPTIPPIPGTPQAAPPPSNIPVNTPDYGGVISRRTIPK